MDPGAEILVVDDEASVCYFADETLSGDGHKVVAVESGEAALEFVEKQEFNLALLDLKLKGMGGLEVLAALRQRSPDTVVVVLTGHASLATAVEALRQGAHDYLFKPCEPAQLRDSVRRGLLKRQHGLRHRELLARLERSLSEDLEEVWTNVVERVVGLPSLPSALTKGQERFLQRGELIIDFMRGAVTLEGHLLDLSPTEFSLLAYLVGQAPRAVSPQELVRQAQGFESEPWEARDMVRSHIYRIRRKVKAVNGGRDIIRTVRGMGYAIREGVT